MTNYSSAIHAANTGPIVFGQGPVNVRWNSITFYLAIEVHGHRMEILPELAPMVIVALAHEHSKGRLLEFLRETFQHAIPYLPHQFYRCGKLMLYKPVWQEV